MILIIKFKNMLDSQNGKVLTLIFQNTEGKLELNYNTVTHISRYKGPYCFISICGDYRSGKSFLLNSLFFDYKGFETSGTTQACTKGINVWSQPVEENGKLVWLLDTEGFGSIQKDSNYDGKIFLLSLLMSSVVLYNSFGAIDENSISKLALACHEAQFVDPKFANVKLFWVLRDFSLQMVDKQGVELTADQYLQECFKEGSNGYNKNEKDFLKKLFPIRHCTTLIRPVIDETTLNSLQNINKLQLRQQFKETVDQLKDSIMNSLQKKVVQGICFDENNAGIILKEFVTVLNSGDIDCGLTCTYQKIKEFQREQEKEKLMQIVRSRMQSTKKLLPVKQEHIIYLQSQLRKLMVEKLNEVEDFTSKDFNECLKSSLEVVIQKQTAKIRKDNTNLIQAQAKDFLYRNMIELYPKFISLTHSHFENKFQQLINPFRLNYFQKYRDYYVNEKELDGIYGRFMEKEIKKIFYELVKRWRGQQKELEERLQELKKFKKLHQEDLKRAKDEKQKQIKSLQEYRREQGRSMSKLKQDMQDAFRQEVITVSKEYEQKLRAVTENKERQLKQLKSQLDLITQQKIGLQTSFQYEKKSLLEKIGLQKEKTDLMNIKYEQLKGNYDMQIQQLKMSYQNKIRIADMKYNQNYNTLMTERKKFQLLTEERRKEENHIMDELQVKNQMIENLNRELQGLEEKYKNELQKILSEEKDILVKTINKKIQQYQYKCKIYEGRLQECAIALQDLEFFERKNDQLQVQVRQLKFKLEEEGDKSDSLSNKLKKCENQLHQKQNSFNNMRVNFQKQINLANQNIYNNKKFIKEVEERHQEEIDYLKRKMETDLYQQASCIVSANEQNMRQNKTILQQKFDKERSQLKEIIKNNYDQIQHLKLQNATLSHQIQKIYGILMIIRNNNQHLGQSVKKDSPIQYNEQEQNSYDLGQISESPEEYSQQLDDNGKKIKFEKTKYLAEQVQQIFEIMEQQVKLLSKERLSNRKEIQLQNQKLDSFDAIFAKIKSQNKHYKKQVDQLRKKQSSLQSLSTEVQNLQQKYESLMKQNFQMRKELDLQNFANQQREQSIKQNIKIYKQTISNLTEEKRLMSESMKNLSDLNSILEQQLERFNLWAKQTMPQKGNLKFKNDDEGVEMSADRIKDLENEIRRLTKRSQQERKIKLQKQSKRQNVFSAFVNQTRITQLQELRKENQNLYRKLQEFHHQELKSMEEKKTNKQKHLQYQQNRYSLLRDQYELYKKKAKQIVGQLEAQLEVQLQQNSQLKKQFQDLEDNILKKYQFQQKYLVQQIDNLKSEKQGMSDFYTKKIAILQQTLNSKINESDKKLAETQLKYEKERQDIEKQHNSIVLEGQRHRLKYEHLLKVNNELLKQIQNLKSKAHQITLKEKYKSKILTLFND